MATLRPSLAGAFPLPTADRVNDLRVRIARPVDPALPGLAPPPRANRRTSAGQLGLVAIPTLAVLVGSALAVGNATQQAARPAVAPARSGGVAAPGAGTAVARPGLLVPRPEAGAPRVLDRYVATAAGSALGDLGWAPRNGTPSRVTPSGGVTVLAGRRAAVGVVPAGFVAPLAPSVAPAVPSAPADVVSPPARAGRHHRHDRAASRRPTLAVPTGSGADGAVPVGAGVGAAPVGSAPIAAPPVGVSTGDPPAVATGAPPTDPGLGKGTGPVDTPPVRVTPPVRATPPGAVGNPIVVEPDPGATLPIDAISVT